MDRHTITLCVLLGAAVIAVTAIPLDRSAVHTFELELGAEPLPSSADDALVEVSDSDVTPELLEAAAASATHAHADVSTSATLQLNEAFHITPYKFFLWTPTHAAATTQWKGRRGPLQIKQKLRAALVAATVATRCAGPVRCVVLGPEFMGDPLSRLALWEYNRWKADLRALSAEPQFQNVLFAPGTFVYRDKASPTRCAADHLIPALTQNQPNEESVVPGAFKRTWYNVNTDATCYRDCLYAWNSLVVAFRGAVVMEHFKKLDGGTAQGGPAFDLTARDNLPPQSIFTMPQWSHIAVGVEICVDHELGRLKAAAATQPGGGVDLQLSVFNPGSIDATSLRRSAVKNGAFIAQCGQRPSASRVLQRNGAALTKFYTVDSQVGELVGPDMHLYDY